MYPVRVMYFWALAEKDNNRIDERITKLLIDFYCLVFNKQREEWFNLAEFS
jgi:hypothetical protein